MSATEDMGGTDNGGAPAPPVDIHEGSAAWLVVTVAGSRYYIARGEEGEWWLGGGANVPNPGSVALPPAFWRIEPPTPWPPVVGFPLVALAPSTLELGDPLRAPGGGKVTSAVRAVFAIDLRPGDATAQPADEGVTPRSPQGSDA